MPDDQNTAQNQDSTENFIPPSPQEPTADAPIPTTVSTPAEVLSVATEAPVAGFSAESNNIPPTNSAPLDGFGEAKAEEKQAENDGVEVDEPSPKQDSKPETAQVGRNEPLGESFPAQDQTSRNTVREVLAKAQLAIQNKKRKKLDSILTLFAKRTSITNDEVEKLLHVSDATATRYLSQLEKEGKIKQSGKTGKGVSYSRI